MSTENEQLPDTVVYGKGLETTFLRNESYLMRAHISGAPDADTLNVPPHWHETHDELIRVLKGQLEVTLDSEVKLYGPEDGEVRIPKGAVHSLRTAKGVECIFEERTDPMDEEKELFFRNFVRNNTPLTNLFDIMQTFYHGDTRPAFPGHLQWLERAVVALVGGYLAPMLGYRRKYETLKRI